MRTWFECFRKYWHLSFSKTHKYFAMPGWEFLLRTPLAGIKVSKCGFDPLINSLFSGVELWMLPTSWSFRPEEGQSFYRHRFKWGSRYVVERLKVLNGKLVKR